MREKTIGKNRKQNMVNRNFKKQISDAENDLKSVRKIHRRKWRDTALVRISKKYLNVLRFIRVREEKKETLAKTLERLLRGSPDYVYAKKEFEKLPTKKDRIIM